MKSTTYDFTLDVPTDETHYLIRGTVTEDGPLSRFETGGPLIPAPQLSLALMKRTESGAVQELYRTQVASSVPYLDDPTRERVFAMLTYQVLFGTSHHETGTPYSSRQDLRVQALQACLELRNTLRVQPRSSVDITRQRNGLETLQEFANIQLNKFYSIGQFTHPSGTKHPDWQVWCKRQLRKGMNGLEVVSRWTFLRSGELVPDKDPAIQLEHKKTMTYINSPWDIYDDFDRVKALFSCYVE